MASLKDEHGQRYTVGFTAVLRGISARVRSAWNVRPGENFPRQTGARRGTAPSPDSPRDRRVSSRYELQRVGRWHSRSLVVCVWIQGVRLACLASISAAG